jgi:hypothetical protein
VKPRSAAPRAALALTVYAALAAIYTHPLLVQARDEIANDRYDPVLNASILWWNATTVPFSASWWTPPHYYPSEGTAAFTENLVGLWPIAAPIHWLTGDPLLTYNLTLFLTWPLSGLAVFLLATSLGVRWGPAFVGGLVFAFAPYRVSQLSHLQVVAPFWLPLALAALHRYVSTRMWIWLVAFGAAWVLQALTNGYFMLFGAVVIALWILYFCSTRATIPALPAIGFGWTVASLPLLPVLLEYKRIHEHFGLERPIGAVMAYSAQAIAWVQTSNRLTLWGGVLRDGGEEANLFPGLTAVVILLAAVVAASLRRAEAAPGASDRTVLMVRRALVVVGVTSALLAIYTIAGGPWRLEVAGLGIRVRAVDRALLTSALCGVLVMALGARRATGRDAFAFYLVATLVVMLLCMGPQIRTGGRVVMESAPYGWLMALPGFEGLRVPTRFWMLGALCLAVAVALGLDRLLPRSRKLTVAVISILSAGVLADGWAGAMPMARAPERWSIEQGETGRPLIELPLGPDFDAAATYRAVGHRRRVVNGVSGYDPPHYGWLRRGLDERNPETLLALTHFGPLDVVVDLASEEGDALARYVAAVPGATWVRSDGARSLYHLPASPTPRVSEARGATVAVASGRASRGVVDLGAALDGDATTASILPAPQREGEWIELDVGSVQAVTGVEYVLGDEMNGYPRRLAIDLSADAAVWTTVWEGGGFEYALASTMQDPRTAGLSIVFDARPARFVRLRLLVGADAQWRIGDLRVY